jgi:hypothetical protein
VLTGKKLSPKPADFLVKHFCRAQRYYFADKLLLKGEKPSGLNQVAARIRGGPSAAVGKAWLLERCSYG